MSRLASSTHTPRIHDFPQGLPMGIRQPVDAVKGHLEHQVLGEVGGCCFSARAFCPFA